MTIFIGPQASGKSVISKIILFCVEIITKLVPFVYQQKTSIEHFRNSLADEFLLWFPSAAWGAERFTIDFGIGPANIRITRAIIKDEVKDKALIILSAYLTDLYASLLRTVSTSIDEPNSSEEATDPARSIEAFYVFREASERKMRADFGSDFTNYQLFIPAGRSFFTSTSKGFAAIEQGLDQITARFGRFYARVKDSKFPDLRPPSRRRQNDRQELMQLFFGGRLRFGADTDYVESSDGRKLPFKILSSGQQELLPLWVALDYFDRSRAGGLVYVEEPEAHLFPSAQNAIAEYMARVLRGSERRKMLITTHSPYLLTKLNNLLKAGEVGNRVSEPLKSKLKEIIPEGSWLQASEVKAYAIKNGCTASLIDSEGLIDAEYLDQASNELSSEFSRLLELENEYEND